MGIRPVDNGSRLNAPDLVFVITRDGCPDITRRKAHCAQIAKRLITESVSYRLSIQRQRSQYFLPRFADTLPAHLADR